MIEKRRGQSATLDKIAADFGVSVRVFRAWMKEAGIQKGSSHYLKPKTLDAIYDSFGVPCSDS